MSFHLVSSFLLRAPLLPVGSTGAALLAHALGEEAIALASPDLAAALARHRGKKRLPAPVARAVERYGRRAAFRATPHGLLAGVAMGTLAGATRLLDARGGRKVGGATRARAHVTPSWGRLAAAGRALLDEAEVRAAVRLRVAPSLLAAEAQGDLWWLALPPAGAPAPLLEVRQAALDPPLAAVLDAAAEWTSWVQVRAAFSAAHGDGDGDGDEPLPDEQEADDYLLELVDQGLLHHDLLPPIVGPPPLGWMARRLSTLAAAAPSSAAAVEAAELLARVADTGSPRSPSALARILDGLPGVRSGPPVHATLVHELVRPATLSREVVARAAELAPLLFRLQHALTPPIAERHLGPELLERLEAMAETFGAGAFDVAALAAGDHGATLAVLDEDPPAAASPSAAVLSHLVGQLTEAAHEGRGEIQLDAATLGRLLPRLETPPSFELFLTPHQPGEGQGWLLGLHAPAGASWGRFADAIGAPMTGALAELAAVEMLARPGEEVADVAFAPSAALADLCTHPAVRPHALALLSWGDPEASDGGAGAAVRAADLHLVIDPAAPAPLELRMRNGAGEPGPAFRPSPLHRVRSTTAAGGVYRLLAGWSFTRQHAPWALSWGALGDLPRLPRVVLDGFVIAPASWRIPQQVALAGGGLARWRKRGGVPALVQVGAGDELLLVDLGARDAAADLARHAGGRAWEVWPPLAAPGRRRRGPAVHRAEAVVAVVHQPAPPPAAAASPPGVPVGAPAAAPAPPPGVVAPPARTPPPPGWTTFKLFGAEERQEAVLVGGVAPVVRAARAAGELDGWFFLRYVDPPGQRHHLRLRARAPSPGAAAAFAQRLDAALADLRATGDLVALETAEYFPETARYGGAATLATVERLFELDSDLALRLLESEARATEPPEADRLDLLVRSWDALARGLGLDLSARRALSARRRSAHARWLPAVRRPELDAAFRHRQRRLAAALAGGASAGGDPFGAALEAHATLVRAVIADLAPDAVAALIGVLAPVLHLTAVRLVGPRRDDEAAALVFWNRTLEGLAARRR